jgi:hypothetical protein
MCVLEQEGERIGEREKNSGVCGGIFNIMIYHPFQLQTFLYLEIFNKGIMS